MRVETEPDLSAFAAGALPWLRGDPVAGNLIAGNVRSRLDGLNELEPGALWIRVLDGDALTGVAMVTPPHMLCVPVLSEKAVVALADTLAERGTALPGVTGPRATVERFVARWSVRTGAAAERGTALMIYELTDLKAPEGVSGTPRQAAPGDLETLADWVAAFSADVHSPVERTPEQRREYTARRIERGMLWLWEDDGVPVSMALRTGVVEGIVKISVVYTPPEHRGHGYAAASVAGLCERLLATPGVERCILYADLDNPTSNGVYRRIGFTPAVEAVDYTFRPRP
ncbi:GNAT family N-acetyltransferase [Phytomonospora endophytica]|uniref:Putative GNAT family acetyltransferase n=1 Tax=Phytomonospora endophytica TaxID=714109 RepID=A0A841F7V6_9ACTN|nr:GNAT family N-acetyltransferase [Phytomonospora endophytica]MBB6032296.1 putative GNAT family acetyltransferase [Phytomonospora endophytica]